MDDRDQDLLEPLQGERQIVVQVRHQDPSYAIDCGISAVSFIPIARGPTGG